MRVGAPAREEANGRGSGSLGAGQGEGTKGGSGLAGGCGVWPGKNQGRLGADPEGFCCEWARARPSVEGREKHMDNRAGDCPERRGS
ncbi:hypothetical protein GCM10009715_05690 [Paeniglutamicibacter psychrophenolicus]